MKEIARNLASHVIVASGISRVARRFGGRDGTIVLYGHRVEDNDEGMLAGLSPQNFRTQLRYLCANYEIISLATLFNALRDGKPAPKRSVALSFDDGFRDNYSNAFPILQEFGVPATIYAVTDSLSDGQLPWAQQVGYMLQHTSRRHLAASPPIDIPLTLDSEKDRALAFGKLLKRMAPLTRSEREAVLQDLRGKLGVSAPTDRMMTWDHAREMARAGHEIGAHSMSHALLGAVPQAEAKREILGSRDAVREKTGIAFPSFCFPGGSLTPDLVDFVASSGFAGSFLPGQDIRVNNKNNVTAFTVSRVGLPEAPSHILEAELDGPFPLLRRLKRLSRH